MRLCTWAIAIVSFLLLGTSTSGLPAGQQAGQPAGPPAESSDADVHVSYVYSDGNLPSTIQAYNALLEERPDLRGRVSLSFLTESFFDDVTAEELTSSDVLVLDIMNQQMLDRFNEANSVDVLESVTSRGRVLAVGQGLAPRETYTEMGILWDERARAYWASGGFSNQVGLMKQALTHAGVSGLVLPDPQPSLDFGYYYPDGGNGRVFATWDEFDSWRTANGKLRPGAPRVAVGFYRANFYGGDTELLNAVIGEVEAQGAEAIPLFGYPGHVAHELLLTDEVGNSRADVALSFLFRFSGFEAGEYLERLDIPVISLVALYGRTEEEWRNSSAGLSMFEGSFQVAVPELAGLVAPTVVGSHEKVTDEATGLTMVVRRPIASRVSMAVQRAVKYAALGSTPNPDKRIALMYYNFPPGKANIGASYLNVAESLANILDAMQAEGYDIGDAPLSTEGVLEAITTRARNVGGYAPGELETLVAEGDVFRIPVTRYREYLDAHAPTFRDKVLADWGPPEDGTLMTVPGTNGPDIIVPAIEYGNVLLMPQPARGWGEDNVQLYHAADLAPPHQYVATYAWLRNDYQVDAVVHLGTHGTLEWLDGKDMGLSEEDAPDALMSDIPDLYVYNVDVVGEGLVARRRGMATLVDHMVPPFVKGGLLPQLAALGESINDYDINLHKNSALVLAYADEIREQVIELGIAKDLGLDLPDASSLTDEIVHEIQEHMLVLRGQNIPFGLHAFGRTPEKELRDSTIDAIVSVDRSLLPNDMEILADDMEDRIVRSGPRELDSLMRSMRGGFVGTGNGGEPIRNPDSYPTGKNFFGVDPEKIPKPAAWELGRDLADQMLADHLAQHGEYPQKVSFVIWGDETMRHEGVLESQIFHLLGTQPVWDVRGNLVDVDVVPRAQLGRPRVDIVIASSAEGMFNNLTLMMDRAVQKVKAVEELDNYVRDHYLETKATLISRGYSEEDADLRAGVRIFDEPPGIFNLNTAGIAAASGTWETDAPMADEYISKMGHGFGNGFWGESMEDVFRLALSGTDKVVHSSSTMLYGALDNDDFFMYMGGLANAIRNIDGETPELVVTNTRDPGNPEMTSIDKFLGMEFRSRYVNPTWIEGMQAEGYAGAGAMREFVEYMWGWDATVPELVDDAMWNESFEVYVDDKHDLGMKDWFEENSPYAYQDISARMLETIRKDYWNADEETETRLLEEFIESVNEHGSSGAEYTAGNPRLLEYVIERALLTDIPVPDIENFQQIMEAVIGMDLRTAADEIREFVELNEPPQITMADPEPMPADLAPPPPLEGFRMIQTQQSQSAPQPAMSDLGRGGWEGLWVGLPVLGFLMGWRFRRRGV
jgi:cobaltochelatase CobN